MFLGIWSLTNKNYLLMYLHTLWSFVSTALSQKYSHHCHVPVARVFGGVLHEADLVLLHPRHEVVLRLQKVEHDEVPLAEARGRRPGRRPLALVPPAVPVPP